MLHSALRSLVLVACCYSPGAFAKNYADHFIDCYQESNRATGQSDTSLRAQCDRYAAQEIRRQELQPELPKSTVGPNQRLLRPAFAFYDCVHVKVAQALAVTRPKAETDWHLLEGLLWNRALGACIGTLDSPENEAMMYREFEGDQKRIGDFKLGIVAAARSHVIATILDRQASVR